MAATDFQEECQLPSGGLLYPSDSPWASGVVIFRMMSAGDEKYIAGARQGTENVMSELLRRCIVSPENGDPLDLLISDRFFLLVKIRQLSYGSNYGFKTACPACNSIDRQSIDLSDLEVEELDPDFQEPIEVTLPVQHNKLQLTLPRGKDEEEIARQTKRLRRQFDRADGDPGYYVRMAQYVRTVDGEEVNFAQAMQFVQGLMAPDSLVIRQSVEDVRMGLQPEVTLDCPSCGHVFEVPMPFSEEFFRPRAAR